MQTIHYVDAPEGSGKTHQLVRWALRRALLGHKTIIAQPTERLISQTMADFHAEIAAKGCATVPITAIHSKQNGRESVQSRINHHLTNAVPNQGEILLITHEALKSLSQNNRRHWTLVVDEVPEIFEHVELNIATTHGLVTPFLTQSMMPDTPLSSVGAGDAARIRELVDNKPDDSNIATFRPLLAAVLDPNVLVLTFTTEWLELLSGQHRGETNFFLIREANWLDGFKKVVVMGADFKSTAMHKLWSLSETTVFEPFETILRYRDLAHAGQRLTIFWMFEEHWTGTVANRKAPGSSMTMLEQVAEQIAERWQDQRFLFRANDNAPYDLFGDANVQPLPGSTFGLNKRHFQEVPRVALLSALNRKPKAYEFLAALGISDDSAHETLMFRYEKQALMRCNLRVHDSQEPVEVIVMGHDSAKWLEARFPGCTVAQLPHTIQIPTSRVGAPKKADKKSDDPEYHRNRARERRARLQAERGLPVRAPGRPRIHL